jgi:hypothetical protein
MGRTPGASVARGLDADRAAGNRSAEAAKPAVCEELPQNRLGDAV